MRWIQLLACAVTSCGLAATPEASKLPPPAAHRVDFTKEIRPLFETHCHECHGETKQKAGLRLDVKASAMHGGDEHAPDIIPGRSADSPLIHLVAGAKDGQRMPPKGAPLTAGQIGLLRAWIDQGANWPDGTDAAQPRDRTNHWAFQAVRKPSVPRVTNKSWPRHDLDRFILARLEERGIPPAATADKATLLRRATLGLTGLPPTPDELAAFLADDSKGAFDKVVDRLLASPRFGERWARHWMDLVRFAETHGSEGDPEIPQAWRYRDYLVRAFNADVPCDQLIREHIAGDLLSKPRLDKAGELNESLHGLAHFRLMEHGFQPIDTLDEQVKTIDNQIDVLSKAFQGLTTSCARCHDHKFDPISQREYYALYGVLLSCRPAQVVVDAPGRGGAQRAELTRLKQRIRPALADAWSAASAQVGEELRSSEAQGAEHAKQTKRVQELERELAALDAEARAKGITITNYDHDYERGAVSVTRNRNRSQLTPPAPIARWSFESDARDSLGGLHAELLGGAELRGGRLIVNGTGAVARTVPLARELTAKTLEVWLALPALDQAGGGAVSVEGGNGAYFDSIVFAEHEPRRWMAGSEFGRRSLPAGGPDESAKPGELVHLAISYQPDGRIALFRNGRPYGKPYRPEGENAAPRTFSAGNARLLFGQRHTGGGSAFLNAEIEEARLYDRTLQAADVAASFAGGLNYISEEQLLAALTPDQRARRAVLRAELRTQRAALAQSETAMASRWRDQFATATKQPDHPLHAWVSLRAKSGDDFTRGWRELAAQWRQRLDTARSNNAAVSVAAQSFAPGASHGWFRHAGGLPSTAPGEFAIEPEGERALAGLLPAGVHSHLLSQKEPGLFASPPFKVESDFISVRALGGRGAQVRLMVDGYPLGNNGIFPRADLERGEPGWTRLNVAYRKGSMAYLEISTAEDATRRTRAAGPQGESWFGVERVVMHASGTLHEEPLALAALFEGPEPRSAAEVAERIEQTLIKAVAAWRAGKLTEAQHSWLDGFVRRGLLPTTPAELAHAAPLIAEYRRIERGLPTPRRAPALIEAVAKDAPLLRRGDHLKPGEPVPRGYLKVAGSVVSKTGSGRLELANAIARKENPLTARVMVNRVWQQLFGRGLVRTADNFGVLGERPTNPELLDHLAARFVADGWSHKELIRLIVTSRTWQSASEPPARALELDPENLLLSHARVRRLEAEAVRDSLLAVSGRLDETMSGPGVNALAPPAAQRRRSVYLTIRRGALNPFLEVFDAPKPFTTLGRRDETTVPVQSLALLNDPFVVELAGAWAASVFRDDGDADARIRRMFGRAFTRPPTEREFSQCRDYLGELSQAHGGDAQAVWRDFAQSLFNLKEFIYVR